MSSGSGKSFPSAAYFFMPPGCGSSATSGAFPASTCTCSCCSNDLSPLYFTVTPVASSNGFTASAKAAASESTNAPLTVTVVPARSPDPPPPGVGLLPPPQAAAMSTTAPSAAANSGSHASPPVERPHGPPRGTGSTLHQTTGYHANVPLQVRPDLDGAALRARHGTAPAWIARYHGDTRTEP